MSYAALGGGGKGGGGKGGGGGGWKGGGGGGWGGGGRRGGWGGGWGPGPWWGGPVVIEQPYIPSVIEIQNGGPCPDDYRFVAYDAAGRTVCRFAMAGVGEAPPDLFADE